MTTPSFLRPSLPRPFAGLDIRFLWPLGTGLLLAVLCAHPLWRNRTAQLAGDFGSHTLYQGFLGLAAALLLWQGYKSRQIRYFWWLLAVSLVTALGVEGLKRVTGLPRPDREPTGFPSGHTTFVFALAWLLTQVFPRWASLWYGVAAGVGWSRVEGHAHFPYQVLCGVLLGTVVGWGVVTCRPGGRREGPPTL